MINNMTQSVLSFETALISRPNLSTRRLNPAGIFMRSHNDRPNDNILSGSFFNTWPEGGFFPLSAFWDINSTTLASSSLSNLIKDCKNVFLFCKSIFSETARLIDRTCDDATLYG